MDNIILNIGEKELTSLVEKIVNRILDERTITPKTHEVFSNRKINIECTCKELGITRQTLNNWSKSKRTKQFIDPHVTRIGKRVWYDIDGLKATIKKYEHFFGYSRDYAYKYDGDEIETTKTEKRFLNIYNKLSEGKNITPAEEIFYRSECLSRGEKCMLD